MIKVHEEEDDRVQKLEAEATAREAAVVGVFFSFFASAVCRRAP